MADDERDVRELVKAVLTDRRIAVDFALDGDQALRMLRANRYDAAVLDVMMPGRSGLEVLEALGPDMPPTVLLTAHFHGVGIEATAAGAGYQVMPKPFDVDHLLAIVLALVGEEP